MRKKNFRATNTLDLADSTSSKTNTLDNIKLIYIERINIIVNILEKEKTYLRHQQNGSKRINLTISICEEAPITPGGYTICASSTSASPATHHTLYILNKFMYSTAIKKKKKIFNTSPTWLRFN